MRLREPGSFRPDTRFCNPYRRRTRSRSDRKLHHLGHTFPHLDRCPCHSPNPHLGFENRPENRSRNHRDNHSGIPRPVPSIVHSPGSLAASPEFDSRWDRFHVLHVYPWRNHRGSPVDSHTDGPVSNYLDSSRRHHRRRGIVRLGLLNAMIAAIANAAILNSRGIISSHHIFIHVVF